MDWVRLPTGYFRDSRFASITDAAEVLFLHGIAYASEWDTGGRVPRVTVAHLSGRTPRRAARVAAELVAAGLWISEPRDFLVADWQRLYSPRLNRAHIPDRVRFAVYDRDGWACVFCDATEPLSLDHIWPWSLGGSDDASNLQTLCIPCNTRKGARV